jgi:hypothetical protein
MTKNPPIKKSEPQPGRPSTFKPDYAEQAKKLCAILGATDLELADFFNVSLRTIADWQTQHAEFREAVKLGKDEADSRIEKSLYHRAAGYSYDAVKVFCTKDGVTKVEYREHMPPDTTACIFWLKNRRPGQWGEKSDVAAENVIYAIADHPPTEDEWIAKYVGQH